MIFVKLKDDSVEKYPYMENDLRADFPDTSFPLQLEQCDLSEFGVYLVEETPRPAVDHTKNVVGSVGLQDGKWVQVWTIQDASHEEIEQRTFFKRLSVMQERNTKLKDCDWTQLQDVDLTEQERLNWQQYRQQLRDVLNQARAPWVVEWPALPE